MKFKIDDWWFTLVIPELRLRQEDRHEFERCLAYRVRPCLREREERERKPHSLGLSPDSSPDEH